MNFCSFPPFMYLWALCINPNQFSKMLSYVFFLDIFLGVDTAGPKFPPEFSLSQVQAAQPP